MSNDQLKAQLSIFFKCSFDTLIERCRKTESVKNRALIAAYLKSYRKWSLTQIGEFLGGYNHSTVINLLNNHKIEFIQEKNYVTKYRSLVALLDKDLIQLFIEAALYEAPQLKYREAYKNLVHAINPVELQEEAA